MVGVKDCIVNFYGVIGGRVSFGFCRWWGCGIDLRVC